MFTTFPSIRLLFPALLSALALGAAPATLPARAAPCAPSFKAIHDFRVGDEFQYRIWKRNPGEEAVRRNLGTLTIRKYRIVSRADSGGTTAYGILGIARVTQMEGGGFVLSHAGAAIDETLRFTDSAGHRLNRCHDDIVPFPEAGPDSDLHTRLRIDSTEAHRFRIVSPDAKLKLLGGIIGARVGDTAIHPIMDAYYSFTYAEGLGLIERIEGGGVAGIGYSEELTGYVRDGKTHGLVTPDDSLVVSIRAMPVRKRPAAAWPFAKNGVHFDLRGRHIPFPALPMR